MAANLERLAQEWRNHGLQTQAEELASFTQQQKDRGLPEELPPLVGNQEIIEQVRIEALNYFSKPEPNSTKMIALLDWIDQEDLPRRIRRAEVANDTAELEKLWKLDREFDPRFQRDIDSVVGFHDCWSAVRDFESRFFEAFPNDPSRNESVLDEMIKIRDLILSEKKSGKQEII